jgi:hypothetical protein
VATPNLCSLAHTHVFPHTHTHTLYTLRTKDSPNEVGIKEKIVIIFPRCRQQAAEDLIKKEKPIVMLAKELESTLKFKPKGKNFKKKGFQSFKKSQDDKVNKITENKKPKGNCFHCGKPSHWKRNCRYYLDSLKKDKPSEGMSNIVIIETNLMDGPLNS